MTQLQNEKLETETVIRSSAAPYCYVCSSPGKQLHDGLHDQLFGALGVWNIKACLNADCGLMWLDPQPAEDDIYKAYSKYYTHKEDAVVGSRSSMIRVAMRLHQALLRVWLKISPLQRSRNRVLLMYLDKTRPGRLLDVGCGDGSRLARMRSLGWEVHGQDLDPGAIVQAQEKLGEVVHLDRLEKIGFPDEYFDCITMNHVIEHVHDPVNLLAECRRILKKGGVLVAVTPNAKSFGHQYFRSHWRGLEPPRHIFIFSPNAMTKTATQAGFRQPRVWTTSANAASFAYGSHVIQGGGYLDKGVVGTFKRQARIAIYQANILFRSLWFRDIGEECVLWATR